MNCLCCLNLNEWCVNGNGVRVSCGIFKELSKQKTNPQRAGKDPSGLPDDLITPATPAHGSQNASNASNSSKCIKMHQTQSTELNTKLKHECHKFRRKV